MATRRAVVVGAAVLLLLCLLPPPARARNITAILAEHKEYALYNRYLSETKVCDEINSRDSTSMTTLVLPDAAMSVLVSDAGDSLPAIKNALRLLSLLDYYDRKKVPKLPGGSQSADTLFQAAGDAVVGATGNVVVSDLGGGKFGFASATPGADVSTVTKEVKTFKPYKFAVLEISAPIEFDGLFDVPSPSNLTRLLERAGCKRFAALVAAAPGVLKAYESAMGDGLTLFAPNDAAFTAKGAPDVGKMPAADLAALLEYHALPEYSPKTTLKTAKGTHRTLAGKRYEVKVSAQGDEVWLDTGVRKSRVATTAMDSAPFCLLTVDSLLLPKGLVAAAAPEPAAAPAPESSADATPSSPPAAAPAADVASDTADHTAHKAAKKGSSGVAPRSTGAFAVAAACCVLLASLL